MAPEPGSRGFWALTKHEDCQLVSRNQELFTSTAGVIMEDFPEVVIIASTSFLAMDDPEHNRLRSIVSRAFTPRRTKTMESWIQSVAKDLVDEMIDKGEGEFCELFAKQMPGRIFAHFFGVEVGSEEAEILMDSAEKMLAWDDPRCAQGRDALTTFAEEVERLQDVALAVADLRRDEPAEDLVSWVVHAEVDGEMMEDWEIAAFFSLLGSAANDTTRHTLAHAVRLFSEHPDQLALLQEDLEGRLPNAVEEVLRHSTPVQHFRRTATAGHADPRRRHPGRRQGRDVVLLRRPRRGGLRRPRPGSTSCGQRPVAPGLRGRRDALLHRRGARPPDGPGRVCGRSTPACPDITLAAEPEIQINHFMHGMHAMPVRWTPAR